jgi:hypothetical protein
MASWIRLFLFSLIVSSCTTIDDQVESRVLKKCSEAYYPKAWTIYAQRPLSKEEIDLLDKKYYQAINTYRLFVKTGQVSIRNWPDKKPILFIISKSLFEDKSIFSDIFPGEQIVGRYYRTKHIIMVSPDIFKKHNTDFEHEIAHYINDVAGNIDTKESEILARHFEKFIANTL